VTERVDFYLLASAQVQVRHHFACRLAEKAYLQQLGVTVLVADDHQARALDELLWTFNDRSFVPHEILTPGQQADGHTPVYIALDPATPPRADFVLNLAGCAPEALLRFGRIAEILGNDPQAIELGRERFRSYRASRLEPQTHKIGAGT